MPSPESQLPTVARAIALLDDAPVLPRTVSRDLVDAAGFVLAAPIVADRDYPPFDKSMMDGIAVRCADLTPLPTKLLLVGRVAAGAVPGPALAPGQCVEIMTGAGLPPGADGVVPVEMIRRENGQVVVQATVDAARFRTLRGAELRRGQEVLPAGAVLGPAQIAAAAMVGADPVTIVAPPEVALLVTGDELVSGRDLPDDFHIRNTNGPMLRQLLTDAGCRTIVLGHAPDERDVIRRRIEQGLRHQALLITGGMSMGRYDFVPGILAELGLQPLITKLGIKPGKPFLYGRLGDCHVFGLPGNPVSSFVCFHLLVRRVLARLSGRTPEPRWLRARLAAALPTNGPREFYQPVRLTTGPGGMPAAEPLAYRGSGDLAALARADALLRRPADQSALAPGDEVDVLPV